MEGSHGATQWEEGTGRFMSCLFLSRTYSDTRRAAIFAGLMENLCAQKEHTLRPLDFKSAQPKPKPSGLTCTFLAHPGKPP